MEGQLADLVLRATEVVYDPYSEKAVVGVKKPTEEEVVAQLRLRPGSGRGVEGVGTKGYDYGSNKEAT